MTDNRDSMVFYRSFYESVRDLPAEEFKACMQSIIEYALDGIENSETAIAGMVLTLTKPQIDANNKRRESGRKGGAPAGNRNAEQKQPMVESSNNQKQPMVVSDASAKQPNVNVNVNANANVNVSKENKQKKSETCTQLIADSDLPDPLKEKMKEWVQYKKERKEAYTSIGFRSLLTQVKNTLNNHSSEHLCNLISLCMANGWKGIQFAMLDEKPRGKPQQEFMQNSYDFDDLEKRLLNG